MKRVALLTALLLITGLAGTGCKKKEPPPTPPPMPGQGMPGPGMPEQPGAPAPMAGGPEKKIVVPDAVKAAWKAVKIEIEYKEKKSRKTFTIPLDSDFKVPGSDITLKVGDFLPHFSMTADSITSASNNLENPAVRIEVLEGKKTIFKGWLFAKYPAVHPFQYEKFGLTLLEPVKK
ncbi:MAG: DUF2155 domain-containing protein [Deltaproteobacteria bacterium]|nr:DUF2155 domain-containing protein [Deltaproteobacteria bacterium]